MSYIINHDMAFHFTATTTSNDTLSTHSRCLMTQRSKKGGQNF